MYACPIFAPNGESRNQTIVTNLVNENTKRLTWVHVLFRYLYSKHFSNNPFYCAILIGEATEEVKRTFYLWTYIGIAYDVRLDTLFHVPWSETTQNVSGISGNFVSAKITISLFPRIMSKAKQILHALWKWCMNYSIISCVCGYRKRLDWRLLCNW